MASRPSRRSQSPLLPEPAGQPGVLRHRDRSRHGGGGRRGRRRCRGFRRRSVQRPRHPLLLPIAAADNSYLIVRLVRPRNFGARRVVDSELEREFAVLLESDLVNLLQTEFGFGRHA